MQKDHENIDPYIERLVAEKIDLERRIAELKAEARTINNLILKKKSENRASFTGTKMTRKNETSVLYKELILYLLNNNTNGLRTSEIYAKITEDGYKINYNTFRRYITDMRDDGQIRKLSRTSYKWVVNEFGA
jgi:hypothetical protein